MIINDEVVLGLEILEEESNFSYKGCENCGKGYGDNVFPVAAIVEMKDGADAVSYTHLTLPTKRIV